MSDEDESRLKRVIVAINVVEWNEAEKIAHPRDEMLSYLPTSQEQWFIFLCANKLNETEILFKTQKMCE